MYICTYIIKRLSVTQQLIDDKFGISRFIASSINKSITIKINHYEDLIFSDNFIIGNLLIIIKKFIYMYLFNKLIF